MIRRRSLLAAMIAACAAPAVVRASSLMPVRRILVPSAALWTPQNGDIISFAIDTSDNQVWSSINGAEFRLLSPAEFPYAKPAGFSWL